MNNIPVIAVVGSLNIDLVVRSERRPQRGETLTGESLQMFNGGKGYNQAVAAARSGGEVRMIGRVGLDEFGGRLMQSLEHEGIQATHVIQDAEQSTGAAMIVVDRQGDNSIIVVPGANGQVTPEDVDRAADAIRTAGAVLMQLEVPLETVQHAAALAHAAGVPVLLNPAPARALPDALLAQVAVLMPNETETTMLTGISAADDAGAEAAARALMARGVGAVVMTLGERGALLARGDEVLRVPGFPVHVVDTTGAGDAFCGALAVQLAQGRDLAEALRYANAAGALATTIAGAEPAMPHRAAVEALIAGSSAD